VPARLARAEDLELASVHEHEAAPVGLSNRNGKFCTMKHEQHCETWLPARQAGQGSDRVDDGSLISNLAFLPDKPARGGSPVERCPPSNSWNKKRLVKKSRFPQNCYLSRTAGSHCCSSISIKDGILKKCAPDSLRIVASGRSGFNDSNGTVMCSTKKRCCQTPECHYRSRSSFDNK